MITSLTNKFVKDIIKLKQKKYRDTKKQYIIEGENLLKEALKNEVVDTIISMDKNIEADIYVSYDVMKKICETLTPLKVIAVCNKKETKISANKIIILDNVQDPGNVGTIIRSAQAFGYDCVLYKCADLYSQKVIRSTQGNFYKTNIEICNDIFKFIKEKNYQIISSLLEDSKDIKDLKLEDKYAIVVGNEGVGISKEIINLSNEFVKIKMTENVESLNVGVAASILMFNMGEKYGK